VITYTVYHVLSSGLWLCVLYFSLFTR